MQGVGPLGWRAHQDCETLPAGPWSTHLEPEPSAIRQTWLFRVHLFTDGLQISVKPAIIKGAEFHLYCLRAPDDQAWQAEERGQPIPMEAPPAALKPSWNEVMPPARMQMMENEMAKFENPLIRRDNSCAYPMLLSCRTSSSEPA